MRGHAALLGLAIAIVPAGWALAQDQAMSFFVTSQGIGKGADLGGLEGADAHCQQLAESAGSSGKTWHAYLSTDTADARDRIGNGPWVNRQGDRIADDVASLHSDANGITKETALDEKGNIVNGRGDEPNRHDILTGTIADGTKAANQTCGDWTMGGADGTAMLGHHDRKGPETLPTATSWNAAHVSRGCSQEALRGTGGDGLFYCFAID